MKFFMLELAVTNLAKSIAWYEARGLTVEKHDAANNFALITDGNCGRIALKAGRPEPSSVMIHFEVETLPPGEVKSSPEGYERVLLNDPDGYVVCCFRWTRD